jgi:hypothetical protein
MTLNQIHPNEFGRIANQLTEGSPLYKAWQWGMVEENFTKGDKTTETYKRHWNAFVEALKR